MRYYFSVTNGGFYDDREGTEFAGDQDARLAATEYAGELMRDHPEMVWENLELTVAVKDESGLERFTVKIDVENVTSAGATSG